MNTGIASRLPSLGITETDYVRLVVMNETREAERAAGSFGADVVRMVKDRDYDAPTVRLHARIAFRFADLALRMEGR